MDIKNLKEGLKPTKIKVILSLLLPYSSILLLILRATIFKSYGSGIALVLPTSQLYYIIPLAIINNLLVSVIIYLFISFFIYAMQIFIKTFQKKKTN